MVGFTLYGIDDEDQQYWMYRLMIDEKHQGKGFGTQAVRLVIEDVRGIKEPSHKYTPSIVIELWHLFQ